MTGFKSLLRSRKVLVAVVGLVGVILAEYSGWTLEVQAAIVVLCYAVIDGIAKEDAALKANPTVEASDL